MAGGGREEGNLLVPVRVDSTSMSGFCSIPGLSELSPKIVQQHRPDSSWLLGEGGAAVARFSLWWSDAPSYGSQRVGLVGHLAARDEETVRAALECASEELARAGCTLAIGPMDGSTWRRYRLLTVRGDEPPFFLEPDNPDVWPRWFAAQGFEALAQYYSAIDDDLGRRDAATRERSLDRGIEIRPLHASDLEDELGRTWRVASEGFKDNFLYTPVDEREFRAVYRPVLPRIRPEFVSIAERRGRAVGFCFALPDLLQAARGEPIDTVVVKTLAVLPDYRGRGLGSQLVARSIGAARALGYRRAILALMHERNPSRNLARHGFRDFRQYTLYSRSL